MSPTCLLSMSLTSRHPLSCLVSVSSRHHCLILSSLLNLTPHLHCCLFFLVSSGFRSSTISSWWSISPICLLSCQTVSGHLTRSCRLFLCSFYGLLIVPPSSSFLLSHVFVLYFMTSCLPELSPLAWSLPLYLLMLSSHIVHPCCLFVFFPVTCPWCYVLSCFCLFSSPCVSPCSRVLSPLLSHAVLRALILSSSWCSYFI